MEKDILLRVEFISERDDEHCRINSAKEIESILNHIAKNSSRVALYYGNENNFILTTVMSADQKGLYLEQGPNNEENQNVTGSNRLIFVSTHAHVKVQFFANHASSVVYQGYPAFYLLLPDSLYRLQRREYFRLSTPLDQPLRCSIAAENPSEKRLYELTITDISGGGIGLTYAETDATLNVGETYNCQFELPDVGEIKGRISVKNLTNVTTLSGQALRHAGCEFIKLDGQSTILLQRYVTIMQRKNKTL